MFNTVFFFFLSPKNFLSAPFKSVFFQGLIHKGQITQFVHTIMKSATPNNDTEHKSRQWFQQETVNSGRHINVAFKSQQVQSGTQQSLVISQGALSSN